MTSNRRLPVVLAGLTLGLFACEQSITGIPDPVVEAVSTVAAVHQPADPNGLVSWWPADGGLFDDVAPSIDGHDLNPNDILSIGGVTTTDGGVVGQAFLFTGESGGPNQFLEILDATDLRLTEFTIDLWALRRGNGQRANVAALIQKPLRDGGFANPGQTYFITWNDAADGSRQIVADVAFTATPAITDPPARLMSGPVVDGEWVHVALTVDVALNATLYVNGVLQSTFQAATGTPFYGTGSIVIGNSWRWARNTHGGAGFNGCIDEVRIFRRALSEQDVAEIYGAGVDGTCPAEVPDVDPNVYPLTIDEASVRLDRQGRYHRDAFDVDGRLPPDLFQNFDPDNDEVTVTFAGVTQSISAGSFVRKDDKWRFKTPQYTPGIRRFDIRDDGRFKIQARGPFDLDLHEVDFEEPVDFFLSIGPYVGEAAVHLDRRLHFRSHDSDESDDDVDDDVDDDIDGIRGHVDDVDGDSDSDGDVDDDDDDDDHEHDDNSHHGHGN